MNNSQKSWILAGIITLIALLPRVVTLDAFLSPDEPQWERNSLGFLEGLRGSDMNLLYQQAHPGITTTWLAVPTIESENWGIKRLPQAIFLSLSVGLLTFLMIRLWGDVVGAGAGFLLAIDPHLIAHSRVLAMDALLSTFILFTLVLFLLWRKTGQTKLLFWIGTSGALATLSKMSGVVVIGFVGLAILWTWYTEKRNQSFWKILFPLIMGIIITSIIILPTLISNPLYIWAGTKAFFSTEHYSQQLHALGPWWYPQAILIWTTPLQWVAALLIPFVFLSTAKNRKDFFTLFTFLILFFLAVQYSIKKGDRYLLPDFVLVNLLAALLLNSTYEWVKSKASLRQILYPVLAGIVLLTIGWQVFTDIRLHPYYLAYRNPFTQHLTVGRTMGWGEGLDEAAAYLNTKPNASKMLVAAYYEGPFSYHFVGEVTSAERLGKESAKDIGAQYVVLYRTMEGRAPERWETKVLKEYQTQTPEHIITLNGEEYVWIYKVE